MKVYCIECVHSCSSVGGDKYDQFCKVLRTLHSLWLHLLTVYKRYVFKVTKGLQKSSNSCFTIVHELVKPGFHFLGLSLSPSLDKFSNSSSPASRSFHLLAGKLVLQALLAHPRSLDAVCRSSLSIRPPSGLASKLLSSDVCHQRSDISPGLHRLMMRTLWRCGKSAFRC